MSYFLADSPHVRQRTSPSLRVERGKASAASLGRVNKNEKNTTFSYSYYLYLKFFSSNATIEAPYPSIGRFSEIILNQNHKTMKQIKFFAAIFFLFVAGACNNDDPLDIPPSEIELNEKSAGIIESDNQFGLELFQKINETDTEGKNIMVSPLSVSLALAMAYNGAEGTTKEQMEDMLHKLNLSPDEINQSYKTLVDALKNHDVKVELDIANGIFYDENFNVKNDFLSTNKEYYDAETKALDFANSGNTLKTINGWVKNKTHDKIESILENISPYDVMVLVNAVYFNGEWTYQFEKDNTADRVFFFEDGSNANVPTMMIKEKFNYYKHDKFEMLELPYGSEKYSMLVFLPEEETPVSQIVNMLSPDNINNWIGEMGLWEKKGIHA